jgi:hypothetical protein
MLRKRLDREVREAMKVRPTALCCCSAGCGQKLCCLVLHAVLACPAQHGVSSLGLIGLVG